MPKISIIIPVYNAENYLEECLLSISQQTFGDFEILAINDGSTDLSLEILKKYQEKEPRLKVFSQVNKGVSAARNRGIEEASGEYITFLDSDDYLELDGKIQNYVDGGAGNNDSVYLKGYTLSEYQSLIANGNEWRVQNFENIKLGDGTIVKGDGSVFADTTTVYKYDISLSAQLTDTDGSEKLSDVTLKNIPVGSTLYNGEVNEANKLTANPDGSYTVKVDENGKAKLTLESQDKLSEDELNSIKASATSNEVNENGEVTDSATTTASSKLGQDIDLTGLKNILEGQKTGDIDLSKNGSQDKLTLTLDDVLKLSGDDNKIKISGDMFDSVALKNENGNDWTKSQSTITEDNKTFDVYTNSGDSTVQVKVEQPISDGITN